MKTNLFNPFNQIAGVKSLAIGLAAILLTLLAAGYNGVHFPDTLSIKVGDSLHFKFLAIQIVANWVIISSLLYVAALLLSKSAVRAIDIYGTQALARGPHLVAAIICFSDASIKFGKYMLWKSLNQGEAVCLSSAQMSLAILQMIIVSLMAIWTILLSVNAFKVSDNVKGGKLAAIYIICLIISMVITGYLSSSIYQLS